jgi:hypothetical protein
MIAYAGIGSRRLNTNEEQKISVIAQKLSRKFVVYSGNAEGADITFQKGSQGKCVVFLPWLDFNSKVYDLKNTLAYYDVGNTFIGNKYAKEFHPSYSKLSQGGQKLMCRNTHQILGYKDYPRVSFVVYCANEVGGEVEGGTAQAVKIARSLGIPTFNIRNNEIEKLSKYLNERYK